MVASLPRRSPPPPSPSTPRPHAIKVLDLLTNRYHVGIVHATSAESLAIEMPRSARLNAGQRVQFVLADNTSAIISRRTMRHALVQHVETADNFRLMAHLTTAADAEQYPTFS